MHFVGSVKWWLKMICIFLLFTCMGNLVLDYILRKKKKKGKKKERKNDYL